MSKAKSTGNRINASLLSSSFSAAGPSEEKKSAEQKEWESMDRRERQQKVNGIIRFILCASSKKIPVKREDLRVVMDGKRCWNIVLQHANEILDKEFGLKIEETKKGSQKVWILINILPKKTRNTIVKENDVTLSYYGLLTAVLSFLLMRPNQTVDEGQLWGLILNPLGIQNDGSIHPQFGNIKTTIDLFIEQSYIEKEKVNAGGSTTWVYRWGPRAHLEVDKKELLRAMCEVYQEGDYEIWEKQFGDLVKN